MRWTWGARAAISGALVSAMVVLAGCSSLLGLGDFKDQKPDASAGNAGAGGSAPEAGGAGGTDGGGYSCSLDGAAFTIMKPTETGGVTPNHSMFVAAGDNQVFVVMGADQGGTVLVRRVTDQPGNSRLGTLVTYSPQQAGGGVNSMYVTGVEVRNGALHVTGYGSLPASPDWTGIDLVFTPQNGPDLGPNPKVNLIPAPCSDVRSAIYRWDAGGKLHSAVTCIEPGDAGSAPWDLYVDGIKIDSKTPGDNNLEASHFVLENKQYFVLTGEAPGEGGIYHAALGSTGSVSRVTLRLSTDANQASQASLAWPVTGGMSIMGLRATKIGNTLGPPAAFWQGVFTDAQLPDLAKVPPPEMTSVQPLKAVSDFVGYAEPRVGPALGAVMAGASMGGDVVRFSIFSPDGVPRVVAKQATQVDTSNGDQILGAAAGILTSNPIVVWDVQNTTSSDSTVKGQVYICN